jgi:hypothetical protein
MSLYWSVAVQTAAARYHQSPWQPVLGSPIAVGSSPSLASSVTAASVSAVTFHSEIRPPDRGEHWSPPLAQLTAQAPRAYLAAPEPPDPVQVGTDVGVVAVFAAVTAFAFLRDL